MLGNFKKEDLRVKRTYRALTEALPKLLRTRNFERITVNDLCEEAQLSRAAFYAHFQDKYDLLKYCLALLKPHIEDIFSDYDNIEHTVNKFCEENAKIITNLIDDANSETREVVVSFFISLFELSGVNHRSANRNPDNTAIAYFCAGGLLSLFEWQVKYKFPKTVKSCNRKLSEMLKFFLTRHKYAEAQPKDAKAQPEKHETKPNDDGI